MAKNTGMISKKILPMIFLICTACVCYGAWVPVGIGGGGAQYAPSISPLDPNLRFVGSDMSGWYRSTDGGNNWGMLDFYQISAGVDYGFFNQGFMCAMAYHPVNPGIVYGWGPQQDSQNNPPALLVSNDAGVNWSVLNATPPWGVARVTVIYLDRANANLMLVGTDSGVYTSTNNGTTFTGPGLSTGYIQGLFIDQSSPAGNRTCYAGSGDGIFRSTDNGLTWGAFNAGLPSTNSLSFCGASTAGGSRLFEIDVNNNSIYTSTNGAAWVISSAADTFSMIACADNDTSTAYCTNINDRSIWKTSDGGTTWAQVFIDSAPVANAALGWISYDLSFSWGAPNSMIGVCPSDSGRAMFTNLGETILTNDGGATWQEAYSTYSDAGARAAGKKWATRGLEMTSAWHYVIDPNNPSYHYICYTDIGFARSTDAGQTWSDTARKGTASQAWTNTFYQIAFNPTPGTIIAAVGGLHDIDHSWPLGRAGSGGIVRSTDYGATWVPSSTGIPVSPTTSVIFDPVNNIYFAASWGNGVYKSTNAAGTNWVATAPVAIGTNHDVYSLKLVSGKLYCLLSAQKSYTNPGGLFMSANQGASWANIALSVNGGPLKYPTDFDVNPVDPNTIYIAAQDGGGLSDGGLWRTTNNGANWTLMNMPVGHTPYGFAPSIDPGNTNNVYYSTENQGLFKSANNGATWARETGIPFASIQRVTFDTSGIYVTTFGGGVWKQPLIAPTQTQTQTATVPAITATQSKTVTATKTATSTSTNSVTSTLVLTSTSTATITETPTISETVNQLWSATVTATQTETFTPPATPTAAQTFTITGTITGTPWFTSTATSTEMPQIILTATAVYTVTVGFEIVDVNIYPNPVMSSSGGFKLKLDCEGKPVSIRMKIYSAAFRLIEDLSWPAGAISGNYEVNSPQDAMKKCSNGIYYYTVTVSDAGGRQSKSRIKILIILR